MSSSTDNSGVPESEKASNDPEVPEIQNKWKIVEEYLKRKGLVKEHIMSYNHFVNYEIKEIVKANDTVVSQMDPSFYIKYSNVRVGLPSYVEDFGEVRNHKSSLPITPHECRLRDLTYAAPITVDIEYIRDNQRVQKNQFEIGRIPVMLQSSRCILRNKTEEQLAKMKECPLDPGGYFIVKGQERVIIMQEQMSKNRMFVEEIDKEIQCHVTSVTRESKSRTLVTFKASKFYVNCHIFTEPIPAAIMMKAFGVETDLEIIRMIACEEEIYSKFAFSLFECIENGIFTKELARHYISTKLLNVTYYLDDEEEVLNVLRNSVISHMPVVDNNFKPKGAYLALMIRRMIIAKTNPKYLDNRDFYGNKRIELAGSLLSLLFEDAFKRVNSTLKMIIEKNLNKIRANQFDILNYLKPNEITNAFTYSISTGNWIIKRFRMDRHGVTQVLSRLNYISAVGMMTRVNSQYEKSRKASGPRSIQPSQVGLICLWDTPEGESCGLVKNLAMMGHITLEIDEDPLITFVSTYGLEHITMVGLKDLYSEHIYIVFINGKLMGVMQDPDKLLRHFLWFRRKGYISCYMSMYINRLQRCIYFNSDGGRLCRPLIIVKNGRPMLEKKHIDALERKEMQFEDFIKQGLIEYLDVNEENNTLIACFEHDLTKKHTHLEIANFATQAGVCASLIPFMNHNQAPRLTYQCAMGKQAIGLTGYNHFIRADTVSYSLVYPQKPIVKTKPLEMLNFDKLPAGQNAVIAIMSYSGFDIEDAVVMNKASIDRGFGRAMVHRTMKCTLKKYPNGAADSVLGPLIDEATQKPISKHSILDMDGIACVGEQVTDGKVLVNKHTPKNISRTFGPESNYKENDFQSTPLTYKSFEPSYVDKVMISSNDEEATIIKVTLRQTRIPEIGDKFSSRHGQKGVIGLIAEQADLPFSETGIIPDIIMNPHGFPSRMTVGKLIEILAGKAGALSFELQDGTAFEKRDMESYYKTIMLHDLNYLGKDIFYSGITGEPLEAYIYNGTVFYQRLKHMVQDKIHARARGPTDMLTRQATEGRSRDGGLRLGEMERDCLIGHGASHLLMERLMISSDQCSIDICNNCGLIGYLNWCHFCKSYENITKIKIPYAFKLLMTELMSMNIISRLQLKSICKD